MIPSEGYQLGTDSNTSYSHYNSSNGSNSSFTNMDFTVQYNIWVNNKFKLHSEGMNITHIGCHYFLIKFSHKYFHIKNILCVPWMTKNSLSNSKLTKNNDVIVEFNSKLLTG